MKDKVLETVVNGLTYAPLKDILIKPLDPIMLTKEVTEMVETDEEDENGAIKYDTKTETKEVESEWREGVILCIPDGVKKDPSIEGLEVGDIIVYNKKFAKEFDLFKNSVLIKSYDIVAKKINKNK